jgi:molecular chaperone GrpE (heat shock protein)
MAGVLASFLPILDKLGELQDKYGEDDFGKSYNALQAVMRQVFTDLGATEYAVNTGDAVDKSRVDAVETEYSESYPKDTVIQALSPGWELQGNIIRSAQCVVSLGSENSVEETSQQETGQSLPIDPTEHMSYGEEGTK